MSLNLPVGELLFYRLPVQTLVLPQFLIGIEKPHLVIAQLPKKTVAMLATSKGVEDCFHVTEELLPMGLLGLSRTLAETEQNPSVITISSLPPELLEVYREFGKAQHKYDALDSRFVSFWRFADVLKESATTGTATLQNGKETVLASFKSGLLIGGWLANDEQKASDPISSQKVLDISVKMACRIDFYAHRTGHVFVVKPGTILAPKDGFWKLYDPDSVAQKVVLSKFGEAGVELASRFNGISSVDQIAVSCREPEERIAKLGKLLCELGMLEKRP